MKQVERERKFLVRELPGKFFEQNTGIKYLQGYMCNDSKKVIRVRIAGNQGFITIKGMTTGISRMEYEYPVPAEEARSMLNDYTTGRVEKVRYRTEFEGHLWEVDVFSGENEGLIIAEIELKTEEEFFIRPSWVQEEVTGDRRYYNSYLAEHPFKTW